VRRLREYQPAAVNPAAAAARNVFLVPMAPVRVPPKAYPTELPASPQLTSSAYDPVRVPGSATSSSSALVVIPWTAPAAPQAGITRSIAGMFPAAKGQAGASDGRPALRRDQAGGQRQAPPPAPVSEASQEIAGRAGRAEHPG
jgi:hypothetical protein